MVTVEKLLKLPKLSSLRVLAGGAGLGRGVGHVTVMEVPDIVKWLLGNDFLITSLYAVRDDVRAQCRLLEELNSSGCACVAVKTGEYVKEISIELKAVADKYGLPLLQIPYDMLYLDIITSVMNHIFDEKNPRVVLEKYIKDIIFEAYTDSDLMLERGDLLGFAVEKKQYLAMTIQFEASYSPTESDMQANWYRCSAVFRREKRA